MMDFVGLIQKKPTKNLKAALEFIKSKNKKGFILWCTGSTKLWSRI